MQPQHPVTWFRHGDLADAVNIYPALSTAPTAITHGIAAPPALRSELMILDITSNAAGAHSFTLVVHGYKAVVGIHALTGTLVDITDATRGPGWSNVAEIAISATGTDARSAHQLQGVSGFTRLAAQVTLPVNAPSVWVDFGFAPHQED